MRLRGSLTELSFRNDLSRSWDGLRDQGNQLFPILVSKFGLISSAFVLNWTPEQAEDLYTVLVNGSKVAWLEVLRESNELVDFQIASVEKYERSLRSQQERIKLAVALDLAIKELDEILSGKLLQKKAEKEKGELPTP